MTASPSTSIQEIPRRSNGKNENFAGHGDHEIMPFSIKNNGSGYSGLRKVQKETDPQSVLTSSLEIGAKALKLLNFTSLRICAMRKDTMSHSTWCKLSSPSGWKTLLPAIRFPKVFWQLVSLSNIM